MKEQIIELAKKEIGYLEKSERAFLSDNSILYEKIKGCGQDNYTKYNY